MKNLFYCLLLTGLFFSTNIQAQPELDTSFGSAGKVVVQFAATGATEDMVVQPDNKIILVGSCFGINFGSFQFCMIRLNENGSFDTSFGGSHGNTGYVLTNIAGASGAGVKGVALQNDGRIIAAGYARFSTGEDQPVLIRHNSDGTLDSSFGTGGIAVAQINTRASKVLIQPDGRILTVGFRGSVTEYVQVVARYMPNGSLDSSFGAGGAVTIPIPGNSTSGLSIALQSDGKILTGGSMDTMPDSPKSQASYLLTRLNQDGSLDTTFDGDGFKTVDAGGRLASESGFVSIAVQTDGRIVALADKNILYRFNPDGSLDTSFDSDGSRPALNGAADPFDLAVTPSGKITVAGSSAFPVGDTTIYYRIARYLPDGSPDPNFSADGFLDIDVSESRTERATAAAPDSQGRMVIGGRSASGSSVNAPWTGSRFSAARLIAPPVRNVGFSGRVVEADGTPVQNAFITLRNGSEIIGNARTNPFGYFRFNYVQTAQTYTLATRAKGLSFANQRVLVDDEITNFTIIDSDLPTLIQGR